MRRVLLGAVIVGLVGCTSGVPARTPECNAAINRCMQSCGNQPEVLSPRSQAIPGPEGTNVQMNNCEAVCQSKC